MDGLVPKDVTTFCSPTTWGSSPVPRGLAGIESDESKGHRRMVVDGFLLVLPVPKLAADDLLVGVKESASRHQQTRDRTGRR